MSALRKIVRKYLIIALVSCCGLLYAQTAVAPEYQVKAVFLYNFTHFIEWPSSTFPSTKSPFIIGILGKDPFGPYLEETMSGENVDGHPLIIQHYDKVDEIVTCHILFINKSEASNMANIVANLKGRNILTLSDAPDFLQRGGMIRFLTKSGKIQFQINLQAVQSAKLDISSKLLRLAEVVDPN